MLKELIEYFRDKKILILGFGREGISTYKLIRANLPNQYIYIADRNENLKEENEFLKKDENVELTCGDDYLYGLEKYDIIMKSPGISFVGIDYSSFEDKIKSQIELLFEFFDVKTIGVTGTKGKSTTSSLVYKMLKDQNKNCMFMGNIGIPAFDMVDKIEPGMIVVLELSSHQLEFVKKSPNISILLNIFEEHLDHYESYQKYIDAKCNIYKYQNANDFLIYNVDNEVLQKNVKNTESKTIKVSLHNQPESNIYFENGFVYYGKKKLFDNNTKRNLIGDYNLNNIMFALGVSELLGLELEKSISSICNFKTLPHRLEFVGNFDGVSFYDNCIGTTPEATIEVIKALGNVDTLIIGGMDRGIDYSEFVKFLDESHIGNIVCMPKTGHDIASKLKSANAICVETLEEAVAVSKKVTQKGMSCLISPAAASYGFFKNFEEKGNRFQSLVKGEE